jgi:hypothetical protein
MMPWNIRLALWITNILCPRIGAAQPTRCPDFLEPDELRDDDLADWAEYSAHQPTTIHHLNRCLKK